MHVVFDSMTKNGFGAVYRVTSPDTPKKTVKGSDTAVITNMYVSATFVNGTIVELNVAAPAGTTDTVTCTAMPKVTGACMYTVAVCVGNIPHGLLLIKKLAGDRLEGGFANSNANSDCMSDRSHT